MKPTPRFYLGLARLALSLILPLFGLLVARLPLSLACVDQDFDITHMQPQLYVARDFEHLFEVLAAFEATLAWKRGGDHGLIQALRAGTVNHLVLADGLEVTGRVVRLVPENGSLVRAKQPLVEVEPL